MKLAVVSSAPVPPTYGGMDRLLEGLTAALRRVGPTDLVLVPVDERTPEGILKGYYDFYHLDLSAYDGVISCKGPSYMVRHPAHVLYLSHRMRVFYDRYEPRDEQHARLRRLVHWLDRWAMDPERIPQVFTIGRTVSRRLIRWGGIPSTPLHPPTTFEPAPPRRGEHFFAPGRLHAWKRFDLIIRAYRAARVHAPLLIAGTGPEADRLRELAAGNPRIRFVGHVDEAELRELYARAIAAIFTPIEEDLGYVAFEAFLSEKPVLTTVDAGEPALIVRDGRSGFVVPPDVAALAERLEWMEARRDDCAAMGRAGREQMRAVTWERVVETLHRAVAQAAARPGIGSRVASHTRPTTSRRIRLLVTDNQMIDPPVGGGRVRIWELYRHLPDDFETIYLGTHDHPGPRFRDQRMQANFREIVMPLTRIHFRAHGVLSRLTRGDATIDVTIPLLLGRCSPRYERLLAKLLPEADAVVCSHPWMTPWVVPRLGDGPPPFVYDAHNCETAVKGALLRRTLAGRWLARRVERVERLALARAQRALVCSPDDAEQFVRRFGVEPERLVDAPNGVDCQRIRPPDDAQRAAARRRWDVPPGPAALFIGSDYPPNIDAVDWLARELAHALPELTILVAGGAGPAWRTRRAAEPPPNVRLLGIVDPPELTLALHAVDLGLNPMELGSGTNIKMLDYMAAGLPIVTSPVGARGLSGRSGEHWAAVPRERFPAVVRELLAHPETARELGGRARALAEQRYDWRVIAARVADALRPLVRRDSRPGSRA